jgi:hypothetical protein
MEIMSGFHLGAGEIDFNLIEHNNITISHQTKSDSLAFLFLKQCGNSLKNTPQGTWHAAYAHSFVALPPQIFVAR